jgi:hypothetical protein
MGCGKKYSTPGAARLAFKEARADPDHKCQVMEISSAQHERRCHCEQ